MNKILAAAICSTAMMAVGPTVYAQMGSSGTNQGTGGPTMSTSPNPPLTPSQVESSAGSISNPPPLDRSGNPRHVSEDNSSGMGAGGDMSGFGGPVGGTVGTGGAQTGGAQTGGVAGTDGGLGQGSVAGSNGAIGSGSTGTGTGGGVAGTDGGIGQGGVNTGPR